MSYNLLVLQNMSTNNLQKIQRYIVYIANPISVDKNTLKVLKQYFGKLISLKQLGLRAILLSYL